MAQRSRARSSSKAADVRRTKRSCGTCTVCCTRMNVPALNKPAGTPCRHQTAEGCGIYSARPRPCREWYCMWIRDDGRVFTEDERPDRVGVILTATRPNPKFGGQVVLVHPVRPRVLDEPGAQNLVGRLRQIVPLQVLPFRSPRKHIPLTCDGEVLSSPGLAA